MPRVLDATLLAAMNSGDFDAYLYVHLLDETKTILYTAQAMSFTLTGTELIATFQSDGIYDDYTYISIERGVVVLGVKNTITTSAFSPEESSWKAGIQTVLANLIPKKAYTAAGDTTYSTVITAFCTYFGFTPIFDKPTAAWLDYQFLPDGKSIILNNANAFLNLLKQKYFIYAADAGNENILFFQSGDRTTQDYTITHPLTTVGGVSVPLKLIWRDEAGTIHTSGAAANPLTNLGYLESTASAPYYYPVTTKVSQSKIQIHLKYRDGDNIYLDTTLSSDQLWPRAKIEEVFDPSTSQSWHINISRFNDPTNTAGGAMPATIERVANYTPLNTSYFNRVLSPSNNNVQSAFDELDDSVALAADLTAHVESPQSSAHGSGFYLRSQSTITRATRTVTVAAVSGTFDVYIAGKKFSLSSLSTTFPTTANRLNYIYIDTDGTLKNSTSAWSITGDAAPACTAYWNGSTARLGDERHGSSRNKDWHAWAHDTIGTRYESGLVCSFTSSTSTLGSGTLHDEDIEITIASKTACVIWYRSGLTAMTFDDSESATAAKIVSGALKYDNAGSLADVAIASYVTNWLYGSNDKDNGFYLVVGQATHGTLVNARAATLPTFPNIPGPEMKILYQVIWRNVSGTPTYVESNDYRSASTLPAGGTPSITAGSVSFLPAGALTSTNVQAAIEELQARLDALIAIAVTTS
jgi:hypothetical protein